MCVGLRLVGLILLAARFVGFLPFKDASGFFLFVMLVYDLGVGLGLLYFDLLQLAGCSLNYV